MNKNNTKFNLFRLVSLALLVAIIPHQVWSNELIFNENSAKRNSGYLNSSFIHNDDPSQSMNEFDDFHRGNNVLPKETGYVILGVLAIGLVVAVLVILNNATNSVNFPDP